MSELVNIIIKKTCTLHNCSYNYNISVMNISVMRSTLSRIAK